MIDQNWQVTIALDPLFVGVPDDRFAGWSNDQGFLEFCLWVWDEAFAVGAFGKAVVGDDRALFGEALDVVGLFIEEGLWNEQGEVGILVAGFLDHVVKSSLHILPKGEAMRRDNHASSDWRVVCQICFDDQLVVPVGVV